MRNTEAGPGTALPVRAGFLEAWLGREQAGEPGVVLLVEWLLENGAPPERQTLERLAGWVRQSLRYSDLLEVLEDGRLFLALAEVDSPRALQPRLEQILSRAAEACCPEAGKLCCAAGGAAHRGEGEPLALLWERAERALCCARRRPGRFRLAWAFGE